MMNKLLKQMLCACCLAVMLPACMIAGETYPNQESEQLTFMKDSGWCWFEDPRAIINNGKLIIGGVSGQSGDI